MVFSVVSREVYWKIGRTPLSAAGLDGSEEIAAALFFRFDLNPNALLKMPDFGFSSSAILCLDLEASLVCKETECVERNEC